MKKLLLVAGLLLSISINHTHAQFLNKLKKQILDKTEEKVIDSATDKISNKAAEKTSKAMENILNPDFSKIMNPMGKKVDLATLPSSYNFDYRYHLIMKVDEGEFDLDYYLSKTEPYMGIKIDKGGDMTIVFDEGNKVIFTDLGGMAMATEMDLDKVADKDDADIYDAYSFKELPNRQFLGYDCIGREMENDEYKFTMYIAPDIESGFGKMFKSEHTDLPPAMQKFAHEYKNGLVMYMKMVDKNNVGKKSKNATATMECVAFEPTNLVVNTQK